MSLKSRWFKFICSIIGHGNWSLLRIDLDHVGAQIMVFRCDMCGKTKDN